MLIETLDATIALQSAQFGNIQVATKTLYIAVQRGFTASFLEHFARVDAAEASACGLAPSSGARVIVNDVDTDRRYAPNRAIAHAAGYRAVQSTPLFAESGEPVGMLSTHFSAPRTFSNAELEATDR